MSMYDIPILMLHSVNDKHNLNPMGSLSIYPRELEGYLSAFKSMSYQMISMQDFLENNYNKNEKFIILTFDDGFRDNLHYAKEILRKYRAKATIFVNPSYYTIDENNMQTWGFMSYKEMLQAEKSQVFDIQAHGMTHEFIFKSDKIIDFYTKEKFEKYYWLSWMIFPEAPNCWGDDAYKYAEKIPEGYPIFEYDRRLSCEKFTPDKYFVDKVISMHENTSNESELLKKLNADTSNKGTYESYSEYIKEVNYQLGECKDILENLLDKQITVMCFPGGGYNNDVLKITEELGYKCYMNASRLRKGNNFTHLENYHKGNFIGFNRTSLSHFENNLISSKCAAKLIAIISIGDYQNIKIIKIIKQIFSKLNKVVR